MPVEESRVVSAHVAIGDGTTVNNLMLNHFLKLLMHHVLIDMGRNRPLLNGDQTILGLTRGALCSPFLELIGERLVIEENPRVFIFAVESVLNLFH